jgi:CDGSH iron-sulfur domain-containing protein 3
MSDVKIRVLDNGPLLVEGPVAVLDQEGRAFPLDARKPMLALCRCGHSKSLPFCDGLHKQAGFQGVVRAPQA